MGKSLATCRKQVFGSDKFRWYSANLWLKISLWHNWNLLHPNTVIPLIGKVVSISSVPLMHSSWPYHLNNTLCVFSFWFTLYHDSQNILEMVSNFLNTYVVGHCIGRCITFCWQWSATISSNWISITAPYSVSKHHIL